MWVYKADLGLWEHQRSRRKTYRKIWSQGTEKTEEEKRLDELEAGQSVQDAAISDLGEATSMLAEGMV